MSGLRSLLVMFSLIPCLLISTLHAAEMPRILQKDGRYALLVDNRPFLMLGGQIHNSSAWPSELPQVWQSMADLHANTLEAPVYWEQFEPLEGHFDYSNIDALVHGAREHNLHLVLLWFGTWKNGNMHYVPSWVKADTKRFPHTIRPDGEPIDVLSPLGHNTLEADKAAFVALMKHLKEIDSEQHTVLLVQVENESGNVGSIRDNSPEANQLFAAAVPQELLTITKKKPGTWSQVFGGEADETFQAYYQAKYINEIAVAGKAIFPLPLYINVWVRYPSGQLPQRRIDAPGIGYPSGGAMQKLVGLWRALAPSLDAIGPDIYSDDSTFVHQIVQTYHRPDNPLLIPEIGRSDDFARYFFYALGEGAIGFAPFGVDKTGWNILGDQSWKSHPSNFELIAPISGEIAQAQFEGRLKTTIEETGQSHQEIDFGDWQISVSYGFPQSDGGYAPGTKDLHGAALVERLGPDEFLVTGIDASLIFHLPGMLPWSHSMIVTAEQGIYEKGVWKPVRIWNGDETDRGLCFHTHHQELVRVKMGRF